jgi:protein phosphatase methylesterase 1
MLKKIFKTDDPKSMRPAKVVDVGELGEEEFGRVGWEHCFDRSVEVAQGEHDCFLVFVAGDPQAARFVWVLLHGAGQSALVWALLTAELKALGHAVVAYDARGHGESRHADERDLSRERQADDCVFVVGQVVPADKKVCLVGHSMGGSIVVAAAAALSGRVAGVVVMDVVEGTAMASLAAIRKFVNSRPRSFASPAQAVRWVLDSGGLRSQESARVSVPAQLKRDEEQQWVWRTDLGATSDYWQGWYDSMSTRFLAIPLPKMLILAGMDRLDTPLTIGQMQGKFQLEILPTCTHQLHEEAPKEIAQKLHKFAQRF